MNRSFPSLRLSLLLGGLFVVLTACQWLGATAPTATPSSQNAVATMVAGTLTAQPPSPAEDTATPTTTAAVPPTSTATVVSAPSPFPTATPTSAANLPGPAEFLWAYRQDANTLTLYSTTGEALWSLQVPGLDPEFTAHTASPVNPTQPAHLWLVYAAFRPENKATLVALMSYHNGQTQTELEIGDTQHTNLIGLTGIPNAPRIAYSTLSMVGYDYHSMLYVHSLGSAPPTQSLYETTTNDGRVIRPLSLGPDGVWFTYDYYGAPMGPVGLYHITYTGEVTQALPDTYTLLGFDAAVGWVAYREGTEGNSPSPITWRPLEIGDLTTPSPQTVTLSDPLFPAEAVPGRAVFSTNHIAWNVHIGPFMGGEDDLRVYTLDGQAVSVVQPSPAPNPLPQVEYIRPVAWLNPDILVLQGGDVHTNQDALVLTTPDLNANASVVLPGVYMGRAWRNTP